MPWIGPELDEGFDMSSMRVEDIAPNETETFINGVMGRVLAECADMLDEVARTPKAKTMTGSEALKLAAEAFREKAKLQ